MQYALGNQNGATGSFTTSIPTGTNVGTYYVWYKVKADSTHYDVDPKCITAAISEAVHVHTLVKTNAKEATENGMKVELCIHYSDFWADPSQQIFCRSKLVHAERLLCGR